MIKLFKLSVLALASICVFISCEKSEHTQQEGLKTEGGDQVLETNSEEQLFTPEIVLHKSYDGSLSAEEAKAKWIEDVNKMESANTLKTARNTWRFSVSTKTGFENNANTNGGVYCRIMFTTDKGPYGTRDLRLDNPSDNFEKYQWDYFLIANTWGDYTYGSTYINWIELNSASLWLVGTDGWYVEKFNIEVEADKQIYSASGTTYLHSSPNKWLDNSSGGGWCPYYTGHNDGSGRMTFN